MISRIMFFFGCIYELVYVVVTCNTCTFLDHHVKNAEFNFKKPRFYNEHYPSILVGILGRVSILVGEFER